MAKMVGIPFSEVKARLMENPDVVAAYQQAEHANEPIQMNPFKLFQCHNVGTLSCQSIIS